MATAKTRSSLQTSQASNLANNTTKDISPADVRGEIEDMAESAFIHKSDRYVYTANTSSVQTMSSSTLADVINETTSDTLPAATYLITLSFGWNTDTNTDDIEILFKLGDTTGGSGAIGLDTSGYVHRQEPQDVLTDHGGNWNSTGSDQLFSYCQRWVYTLGSDDTLDVLLQIASTGNTNMVSIWDVVLTVEKISQVNGWAP